MASLPFVASQRADWHESPVVADELIGRLHRAGEAAVLDLTSTFEPLERANLAAYCYRKAHLHGIGLAIAATCDRATLIQAFGTALGNALYTQSRERVAEPTRAPSGHRMKITLATYVPGGSAPPALGFDDVDDDLDEAMGIEPASDSVAGSAGAAA